MIKKYLRILLYLLGFALPVMAIPQVLFGNQNFLKTEADPFWVANYTSTYHPTNWNNAYLFTTNGTFQPAGSYLTEETKWNANYSLVATQATVASVIGNKTGTGNCPAGQIVQNLSISGPVCTTAGSGSVTNIATGNGITGGPITTTGTLGLDSNYIWLIGSNNTWATQIALNSIGNWSANYSSYHPSNWDEAYQLTINGTFQPIGSYLTTETDPEWTGNSTNVVYNNTLNASIDNPSIVRNTTIVSLIDNSTIVHTSTDYYANASIIRNWTVNTSIDNPSIVRNSTIASLIDNATIMHTGSDYYANASIIRNWTVNTSIDNPSIVRNSTIASLIDNSTIIHSNSDFYANASIVRNWTIPFLIDNSTILHWYSTGINITIASVCSLANGNWTLDKINVVYNNTLNASIDNPSIVRNTTIVSLIDNSTIVHTSTDYYANASIIRNWTVNTSIDNPSIVRNSTIASLIDNTTIVHLTTDYYANASIIRNWTVNTSIDNPSIVRNSTIASLIDNTTIVHTSTDYYANASIVRNWTIVSLIDNNTILHWYSTSINTTMASVCSLANGNWTLDKYSTAFNSTITNLAYWNSTGFNATISQEAANKLINTTIVRGNETVVRNSTISSLIDNSTIVHLTTDYYANASIIRNWTVNTSIDNPSIMRNNTAGAFYNLSNNIWFNQNITINNTIVSAKNASAIIYSNTSGCWFIQGFSGAQIEIC